MIRKTLKWIGIVLSSLIGLLVLAFIILYANSSAQWNRIYGNDYEIPMEIISIPTDPASITRGEHIATIRGCRYCHGDDLSGSFDAVPGLISIGASIQSENSAMLIL